MQTIYMVPHSHYDAAWVFSREEYLQITEDILGKAVELLKKYPEYRFCWEQAYPLKMMEQRNPALWRDMRTMIRAGRIEIVDGQYLMPDTMLPAGEVLVREIAFGKRYWAEKFGIDVPVAWCSDSFGMNAQLPQIYKKSGYRWLAFRRGTKQMESEFVWRGLDGTSILAHWMPVGYRAGFDLDRLEENYRELNKYATTSHILMPSGSGSTPPQEELLEVVEKWNRDHLGTSRMRIATASEFFRALEGVDKKLEVHEGELYDEDLSMVFPQVCSSRMWIVMGARRCENLLSLAEGFATLAWVLGAEYPGELLNRCWEKMLFIGFHDVISGCGVDEIYDEVRETFSILEQSLQKLLESSLAFIVGRVNTVGDAVVVFSSVCWRTQNWCEVEVELPGWEAEPGLSYEGEEIEVQVLEAERDEEGRLRWAKLGFIADLPPLGYRAYRLVERTRALSQALVCEGNEVSNAFFRLRVDPENGIVEIFDKRGKMVLRGNELNIENDIGDLYYHRHMFFELIKNDSGEGIYYGTFKPDSFRVERGPLKLKLVVEEGYYCLRWPYRLFDKFETKLYKHRVLDVIKEIIVYRDLPRIEFVTRVNSRYPNTRLRVRFDTFKERMQYYRETQFGVVREPTELFASLERTGTAAGIPSFQSWCCYGDGTRGVIFMNRGLPATEIEGSNVYLTLLRSVGILSADGEAGPLIPTPDALELNRDYTFEYAVEAYSGDCADAEVYERGRAFHRSVVAVQADRTGDMPQELSFLSLSVDNLILSAFKKADDGDAVILRFFEAKGEQTTCECTFFRRVKRVVLTDLLENEEGELRTEGNKVTVMFRPFEILTLKVEL